MGDGEELEGAALSAGVVWGGALLFGTGFGKHRSSHCNAVYVGVCGHWDSGGERIGKEMIYELSHWLLVTGLFFLIILLLIISYSFRKTLKIKLNE